MRKRDRQLLNLSKRLEALGIVDYSDQDALRRIEMTLSRWAEHECNGNIQRDETSGKPFWWWGQDLPKGGGCYLIADKEAGALKRLRAIMGKYDGLWHYVQGDPRGCALYVGRWEDIPGDWDTPEEAQRILEGYYTRGVAVCL